MLKRLVRAVGIEPTLLSELDFELGAAGGATLGEGPILFFEFAEAFGIRHFKPNCARICVSGGPSPLRAIRKGARGDPLPDR